MTNMNNLSKSEANLFKTRTFRNISSPNYLNGFLNIDKNIIFSEAKGVQAKGPLILNDNFKFLKLDDLNTMKRNIKVDVTEAVDYYYPSISEELASILLDSIDVNNFEYLSYSFEILKLNNKEKTGAMSNNYLINKNGELKKEYILTAQNRDLTIFDNVFIDYDKDFKINIQNSKNNRQIFESLISYFKKYGVNESEAKDFILKQAAFDVLTANYDRKVNPANFVFIRDPYKKNSVKPLNIDYGRCYVLEIHKDSYELVKKYELDTGETKNDILKENVEFRMKKYHNHGGIFSNRDQSGKGKKETVDFILENGFIPYKINRGKLEEKQKLLRKKVKKYKNGYLSEFVEMKIIMMDEMFNDREIGRLCELC